MSEKVVIDFNSRKTECCKTFSFLRIEGRSKSEAKRTSSNKTDKISNLRWTLSMYADESKTCTLVHWGGFLL